MLRIGFLGPKGTFSHEALEYYMKDGEPHKAVDYASIPDILLAVEAGEIEEAIVPIENSLEGAINATMDIMATDVKLMIKAEIVIAINQNLLVKKGTVVEDIKHVLSHPQAIGQCRKFLNTRLPGVEIRYVYSTAGAAEEVALGNNDSAAIGSAVAAEAYGLEVLTPGIQDGDNNLTRFVVISGHDCARTRDDKTSIVFSTENKPGSLYKILEIFNLWDINMERIESRPAKDQLGRYIFFIDIDGHRDDEDVRDAITMIRRKTSFFRLLGSYPRYRDEG